MGKGSKERNGATKLSYASCISARDLRSRMIRLSDSCSGSEFVVRSDRVNDSRESDLSWWWLIAVQLVCQTMDVRVDEPIQPVRADVN